MPFEKEAAITPSMLRERLIYNPETGGLIWSGISNPTTPQQKAWNTRYAGSPAFTAITNHGYAHGSFNAVKHQAHRIAWAIYYGEWPMGLIDHINGNRSDNRLLNLRTTTRGENAKNKRPHRSKMSALPVGIYLHGDCFRAKIGVDGKSNHIGIFTSLDAAVEAFDEAKRRFGFHPNHGKTAGELRNG